MNAIELKCRREALGLSRDALADTLGVAEKSITRWEFGKNPPRDWSWIDSAMTRLEDYRERLVEELIAQTLRVHEQAGAALMLTYASRGSFYRWLPEMEEPDMGDGIEVIPVELHRAATAEAARRLRVSHGLQAVIEAVPTPQEGEGAGS